MSTILRVRHLCAESSTWEAEGWCVNALNHVSLDVGEREIVVLLGAPGAGKTMLIQAILDLLQPKSGDIRLFGFPSSDWTWKPEVGYLPQSFWVHSACTARAFLRYIAEVREIMWGNRMTECVDALLEAVGLSEIKCRPLREYSKEMMMRLGMAQALLHNPRLLILDEPSEQVGWKGVEILRGLLMQFRSRGGGTLLTARRLTEFELSADRIVLLHEGRVATVVDMNIVTERASELVQTPQTAVARKIDTGSAARAGTWKEETLCPKPTSTFPSEKKLFEA